MGHRLAWIGITTISDEFVIEVNFNAKGIALFRHRLYAEDRWRDGLPPGRELSRAEVGKIRKARQHRKRNKRRELRRRYGRLLRAVQYVLSNGPVGSLATTDRRTGETWLSLLRGAVNGEETAPKEVRDEPHV